MAKNRKNAYWLLLLLFVYAATILLSVGQTQAHYEDRVSCNTVLGAASTGVTSNCLVSTNEPALTVLVGELQANKTKNISIWLKSSGSNASGKLAWSLSDPECAKYVTVTMKSGMQLITPDEELDVLQNIPLEITMSLKPTAIAHTTPHDAMKFNVLVTWGEEMWGTFQVILPQVKEEVAPTEPPSSGEGDTPDNETGTTNEGNNTTNNENQPVTEEAQVQLTSAVSTDKISFMLLDNRVSTNADAAVSASNLILSSPVVTNQTMGLAKTAAFLSSDSTTDPTGSTDPTDPTGTTDPTDSTGTTDPTDPTGTTDPTDPTGTTGPTDPTGTTDPIDPTGTTDPTDPTGTTDPTDPTGTTDPTDPTGSTDPADPTDPSGEEEPGTIEMRTLSSFDASGKLPVTMQLTGEVTSVRLGLLEANGEEITLEPLPDYTMFSLNEGESYYMMYEGYIAEFVPDDVNSLSLILDFSCAELNSKAEMRLTMEAYAGENLVSVRQTVIKPNAQDAFQIEEYPRIKTTESLVPRIVSGVPVLNQNNLLAFNLPKQWSGRLESYSVEMLTMTSNEALEYVPVTLSNSGLSVTYTDDAQSHNLVLGVGSNLPPAGTYRINMKWYFEGICYEQKQITFFINYSAYTTYTLGG